MRTKTLLLTAALSAAGFASASAQVFSVNAVGFVNLAIPSGFSMIANPLLSGNDTIGGLLPNPPDGATIYKFGVKPGDTAPSFSLNIADGGAWARPADTLNPGEGAFIFVPSPGPLNVTFVGEVPQGTRTTHIEAGFSIHASQVPQSATATILGFPGADGDQIFRFNNATGTYVTKNYDAGWAGGDPVPNVGESFFIQKAVAVDWVRTFSVNTP